MPNDDWQMGEQREALESYRLGARLEADFVATSTYNRVQAIRLALISGASKLAELRPEIASLEFLLTRQLTEERALGDCAWSWADLGDCRALLGEVPRAVDAYLTFLQRVAGQTPGATLEALREIIQGLEANADPGAALVTGSLSALESIPAFMKRS